MPFLRRKQESAAKFASSFMAAQPDLYRRGLLRLIPCGERAGQVLDRLHSTLESWLPRSSSP